MFLEGGGEGLTLTAMPGAEPRRNRQTAHFGSGLLQAELGHAVAYTAITYEIMYEMPRRPISTPSFQAGHQQWSRKRGVNEVRSQA